MKYHPDKNPGDKVAEEKFKEATEAYQILNNEENRAKYDRFGHDAFSQGGGFSGDFSGFEDMFSDIFSSFFGGSSGFGGRSSRGQAGRDLRYNMEVEFEEAVFGAEKEISLKRDVLCEDCSGSGAAKGSSPETCSQCAGNGQVGIQQGFFTIARTCPVCSGSGQIVRDPCTTCSGRGKKSVQSKLKVNVPAGIDHGQQLKMRDEGEAGTGGGPNGDLYVQILVKKHAIFDRHDNDLVCDVPVNYASVALGSEIEVPTLEGTASVKIPAGTPSGKIFRLKGKGVPVLGTSQTRRGDLHVRVHVHVPKKMSEEQKKLLEQLREIEGDVPSEEEKGFFERVKEMFA